VCLGCGTPTASDGAFLCGGCTGHLVADLESVPDLLVELDVARTKQDRIGRAGGGRGTPEPPLGYRPAAVQAYDRLDHTIRGLASLWANLLGLTPTVHHAHLADCAEWLADAAASIRLHADAGTTRDDVRYAVRVAWRAVDRPAERAYAGPCDECGTDLYGNPRAKRLRCKECGTDYVTADRRAYVLNALREHLATAAEIAAGIGELYGQPINRKRINQWHSRGRLTDHGVTLDGDHDPLFRIGDVLDLAAEAGSTRPGNRNRPPAGKTA